MLLLEKKKQVFYEACHFCNLSLFHQRRAWATHRLRTLNECISRKQLRGVSIYWVSLNNINEQAAAERWGSGAGGWWGGTWDLSSVGAWVRLEDRVQAAGPDTGTQTYYCPWAFKHRLVWSGRRLRAQMKAGIINIKDENDYLQQKMSPLPL